MLTELLKQDAVPVETLHSRYGALLELVRRLLGIVPNCDSYLEIWPPAFRAHNVMVPNLLNLPFMLWGLGAPRATVGLAMYVSSRTAGCAYCSAHACTLQRCERPRGQGSSFWSTWLRTTGAPFRRRRRPTT